MTGKEKRKIVIPGEIIASGTEFLPGEGTYREGKDIFAEKYGLAEEDEKLVRVIPLSGVYIPRKGNTVIGKVIDVTFNGWIIDIAAPYLAFLSVMECPRFINKNDITEFIEIGDMVIGRVYSIKHRGIDLTIKGRGLGNVEGGMILQINSNKVPRVIGKEGSMINMIKDATKCDITVGQNGIISIKGQNIKDELFSKEAILFVSRKSFVDGLTEKVNEFLKKYTEEN